MLKFKHISIVFSAFLFTCLANASKRGPGCHIVCNSELEGYMQGAAISFKKKYECILPPQEYRISATREVPLPFDQAPPACENDKCSGVWTHTVHLALSHCPGSPATLGGRVVHCNACLMPEWTDTFFSDADLRKAQAAPPSDASSSGTSNGSLSTDSESSSGDSILPLYYKLPPDELRPEFRRNR